MTQPMTHEQFIRTVADHAIEKIAGWSSYHANKLRGLKLVYGIGAGGYRGLTVYGRWHSQGSETDILEVAASGEESAVQLAGTTIHELAHSLAGFTAGHGKDWKLAAELLGLTHAEAAGQAYELAAFDFDTQELIRTLTEPIDGKPLFNAGAGISTPGITAAPKACPLGIGTRGGKSRGKGSGSRLRLYVCGHGVKARVASDDFRALCQVCNSPFKQVEVN